MELSEIPWAMNEELLLVDLCMVLAVRCLDGVASCLMFVVVEMMVLDFAHC